MIRVGKMTPQETRWEGCHFPHSCLFMLNSPWVTARPWQNKIRAPFCTSISLSHGIGWWVSGGEEHCTSYNVQVCFSPLLCLLIIIFFYLSILIFISASFLSSLSLSLFLFASVHLLHLSLSLPIHSSLRLVSSSPFRLSSRGKPRLKTQGGFGFC